MRVRHVWAANIFFVTLEVPLYAEIPCRSAFSALGSIACLLASMFDSLLNLWDLFDKHLTTSITEAIIDRPSTRLDKLQSVRSIAHDFEYDRILISSAADSIWKA